MSNPLYSPASTDISRLLCVAVMVASLQKKPFETEDSRDDLRESQLLTNELFWPLQERREWYYGQAVEQPYYTRDGWIGYPGWVKKNELASVTTIHRPNAVVMYRDAPVYPRPDCTDPPFSTLPFGSRVYAEPELGGNSASYAVHLHSGPKGWVCTDSLRLLDAPGRASLSEGAIRKVIENAFLFIGVPYRWGGMRASSANDIPDPSWQAVSGVDCSALVCLSYRLSGVDVPRNAHHQWIWAHPIHGWSAQAGDLVFIAREDEPKAIRHVMICTGQESLIEASETGRAVSPTTFAEKFGRSLEELKRAGFAVRGRRIYFGRITRGLEKGIYYHP